MNQTRNTKGIDVCNAMTNEGITDPDSKEGINFCVNSCPYQFCIVATFLVFSDLYQVSSSACFLQYRGIFACNSAPYNSEIDDQPAIRLAHIILFDGL